MNDNFDLSEVSVQDFELIPTGDYPSVITNVMFKPVKSNPNAEYLNLEFTISYGSQGGRKAFSNLNLVNPNPQTVSIALSELKRILIVLGLEAETKKPLSRESIARHLSNREITISLDKKDNRNVIKKYLPTVAQKVEKVSTIPDHNIPF